MLTTADPFKPRCCINNPACPPREGSFCMSHWLISPFSRCRAGNIKTLSGFILRGRKVRLLAAAQTTVMMECAALHIWFWFWYWAKEEDGEETNATQRPESHIRTRLRWAERWGEGARGKESTAACVKQKKKTQDISKKAEPPNDKTKWRHSMFCLFHHVWASFKKKSHISLTLSCFSTSSFLVAIASSSIYCSEERKKKQQTHNLIFLQR